MKVKDLIQRIQSLYSKGVNSDDTRLSPVHIYNKITTVRSKLLSQEAKKKQKLNRWNYQTLPCVELILANSHECPCVIGVECKILRSKHKIPKPLTDYNSHLISSVTSIDGKIIYGETTWESKIYDSGNKYTSNMPDYFIRNEYLYITDKLGPKMISITGLFEDPLEVEKFPSYCANEDCIDCDECVDFNEIDFPIDADLIDTMIEMCYNELLNIFPSMIEDSDNNSSENIQMVRK
jgi:hypothetical protein